MTYLNITIFSLKSTGIRSLGKQKQNDPPDTWPGRGKTRWLQENERHAARAQAPLLRGLGSALGQEQHAVLFLVHDRNLGWGDGLVGLARDVTPLWGLSRPDTGTYKTLDSLPRAHLRLTLNRNWLPRYFSHFKDQKLAIRIRKKWPHILTLYLVILKKSVTVASSRHTGVAWQTVPGTGRSPSAVGRSLPSTGPLLPLASYSAEPSRVLLLISSQDLPGYFPIKLKDKGFERHADTCNLMFFLWTPCCKDGVR